ncbi:MAG: hypothetical protein M3O34_02070 [Chloroflexota bacterium]|nr:hypothetical protein [Chloroflexota bacterium]
MDMLSAIDWRAGTRLDRERGTGQERELGRPSGWQRIAAIGMAGILAAMTLLALPILAGPVSAQELVAVDEVLDEPSWYYSQTITVSGPIGEVIGPHALTIESLDDLFSDDLLVVDAGRLQDLPGWGLASIEELEDDTASP